MAVLFCPFLGRRAFSGRCFVAPLCLLAPHAFRARCASRSSADDAIRPLQLFRGPARGSAVPLSRLYLRFPPPCCAFAFPAMRVSCAPRFPGRPPNVLVFLIVLAPGCAFRAEYKSFLLSYPRASWCFGRVFALRKGGFELRF